MAKEVGKGVFVCFCFFVPWSARFDCRCSPGPLGVHVAHVRIDCAIDGPKAKQWMGDKYDPELLGQPAAIAETYYQISQQSRHAWSNEVEIRPYKENWTC